MAGRRRHRRRRSQARRSTACRPTSRSSTATARCWRPGLVDLRVKTGEPGAEPKETLKSAARAAAAGGVTSIVVQPDTDPAVDEPSVVDFILRRARDIELVHVYPAGAATKGLAGEQMAEIGLMREAGCVYVTDADRPIVDSKVMRRRAGLRQRLRRCWSRTARPTPG